MSISTPESTGTVSEYASVKNIYDFLLEVSDPTLPSKEFDFSVLTSQRVFCEYSTLADQGFYEKYPNIDQSYLDQRVTGNSVALYEDEWRIVVESDGTEVAFHFGKQISITDVPDELVVTAEEVCDRLMELTENEITLSPELNSQLEDLGYL